MLHCAAMPLVLTFLPIIGAEWLADEGVHRWLAVAALGIGMATFVPGFRRHRRVLVPSLAAAGLGLLVVSAFMLPHDCCASGATLSKGVDLTLASSATETESLPSELAASSDCSAACCQQHTPESSANPRPSPAETELASGDQIALSVPDSEAAPCCLSGTAQQGSLETGSCCPTTVTTDSATLAGTAATPQQAGLVTAWLLGLLPAAWWTPVGCLLLVSAHGLNQYFLRRHGGTGGACCAASRRANETPQLQA